MHRGQAAGTTAAQRCSDQPQNSEPEGRERSRDAAPRARAPLGPVLARAVLGLGVATVVFVVLVTIARRSVAPPSATDTPDEVMLRMLAWVGVVLAAWLVLGSALGVLALLPGAAGRLAGEVAERVTPLAVRRLLTLVLGASVGSLALPVAPVFAAGSPVSLADEPGPLRPTPGTEHELVPGYTTTPASTPALTPTTAPPVDRGRSTTPSDIAVPGHAPGPGFLPSPEPARPTTGGSPGYLPTAPPRVHDTGRSRLLAPAPRIVASSHDLVTVRRGDTLWSIAARHLGPGASDAEVAHEWPRWYAANRDSVGEDPDLLLPGQQLRPPTAPTEQGVQR